MKLTFTSSSSFGFRMQRGHRFDRNQIIQRLPLERLMVKLGLFAQEPKSGIYPCPLHNEANGKSFSIDVAKGVFNCFGSCDFGGTGFDLLMRDGKSFKEAIALYAQLAGATETATPYHIPRRAIASVPPKETPSRFADLPAIPKNVADVWHEGVDYLKTHLDARENCISERRCWPLDWVDALVEMELIGMPVCCGKRGTAFPVHAPPLNSRLIGFHVRLDPRTAEERAQWRYWPNERMHGQKTPSMPFIMGASSFCRARLLVILGGQWDAITFAGAAGWLGDGKQLPDGVCVIAPRGDSGAKTFLDGYESIWPKGCNVLLLPDGDASGARWLEGGESFAQRIKARGCRVAVVATDPHKDFNDLYRVQTIAPEQITELLAAHGMEVAK